MLITLTTDFGYQDAFVGVMKGVIARINPEVQVIDLTHGIPAHDVMAGALTLRHGTGYFPPGTIHVAVVDPGVGSRRRPLLIESEGNYFIGPDNGILSLTVETKPTRIVHLSNPAYQLNPPSRTFHGRDIFAPAAAYLSMGISPASLGEDLKSFVKLRSPVARRDKSRIDGEIIYIDHYGNLFTNIREHDLTGLPRGELTTFLGPIAIRGIAPSYGSAAVGEFVAILNSWGMLEIAANKTNAQQRSRAKVGAKVTLTWKQ